MATRVIDDSKLNDIAVAIQSKDSGGQMTVDEMPERIEALPEIVDEDAALVLIDWEGTLLRSYTRDEVMALTSLPNPSTLPNYAYADHEWLVFQEWNWSLAGIKNYCQKYPYMSLYVAAIYNPSDGQDHYEYYNNPRVQTDGRATIAKFARNNIGAYSWSGGALKNVSLPNNFYQIGGYGFKFLRNLKNIGFPKSFTSFGGYSFNTFTALEVISLPETFMALAADTIGMNISFNILKHINFPDGITRIFANQFNACANLKKINIPNTVTQIDSNAFGNSGLLFVWIPKSVTTLGSQLFGYSSLLDAVIEGKPTASYSSIFVGCDSNLKIYVPQTNLSWFSTETNWADIYAQYQFVAIEDNIEYLERLGFNVDEYKEVS